MPAARESNEIIVTRGEADGERLGSLCLLLLRLNRCSIIGYRFGK